ncbi:hypothetical protein XaplCFBP3123_10255 [Xanthomonas arboricola pv. populi]|nr:hypothetical protein XaplCFBP3123_10255 [Xanthomonas arboricola pv. populi]
MPPVRQLKIFYPPTLLEASHKQKCANLLRRSRPMRASACAANGMRCTLCRGWTHAMLQTFFTCRTPSPHDWLTSESRHRDSRVAFDDMARMAPASA